MTIFSTIKIIIPGSRIQINEDGSVYPYELLLSTTPLCMRDFGIHFDSVAVVWFNNSFVSDLNKKNLLMCWRRQTVWRPLLIDQKQ